MKGLLVFDYLKIRWFQKNCYGNFMIYDKNHISYSVCLPNVKTTLKKDNKLTLQMCVPLMQFEERE